MRTLSSLLMSMVSSGSTPLLIAAATSTSGPCRWRMPILTGRTVSCKGPPSAAPTRSTVQASPQPQKLGSCALSAPHVGPPGSLPSLCKWSATLNILWCVRQAVGVVAAVSSLLLEADVRAFMRLLCVTTSPSPCDERARQVDMNHLGPGNAGRVAAQLA